MDRYEKLKDYALDKVLEYQNKFEITKKDFEAISCNENTDKWYALAQRLQERLDALVYAKKKELRLKIYEQKYRALLEGFYNNGYIFDSWVYHVVNKDHYGFYTYRVEDKHFKTLSEAKEYSISLGERSDWLEHAYNYL